jgi:hypothetical protein
MSAFDFNTADEQRDFDVIPNGTIAVVQLNIREGNAGEDGLLKRSQNGQAEGLDCEFIVVEGPHAKRKFFGFMVLSGTTDGHATAADISRSRLRAVLESARGIKPADVSEAAKKARVAEYRDFDGVRFMAKIGVEPAKGDYKAKNILATVITPEMKEWRPIEQVEQPLMHATPATEAKPGATAAKSNDALTIKKPEWAK